MSRPSDSSDMLSAIATSKLEILELIEEGRVPESVRSFSELHDFIDANELGGLCDEEAGIDWSTDHCNLIQSTVGHWLSKKGHLA